MDTGTDLFTAEVLRFLTAGAQQVPTLSRGWFPAQSSRF
jgi:hypothetical protein